MNGLVYHMALQAKTDDDLRAAARKTERPARRRVFRRSF